MTLPAPNLDDRRFQELVDDAKRMVMKRCPEWTDHNVSDPGITLIETFAFMTDQLLYRLNRVPERFYVKFLELIGVRLFPPTPARVPVTFWLTAPAGNVIRIALGTEVATLRTEADAAVGFSTAVALEIVPCAMDRVATQAAGSGERADATQALERDGFRCFSEVPQVGDALVIAVTEPVPSCAVRLRFRCNIHGHGVDPKHPPLAWDAFDGEGWVHCEVDEDSTGGLNRDGDVILHVPPTHVAAIFDEHRAAWIRARVTEAEEGQPAYSSSPIVHAVTADTVGGTVEALNAEIVEGEVLGVSEGVAGQRFRVSRSPVLAGSGAPVLEVSSEEGWEDWTEVRHFAASGPVDRHFVLDAYHGEVSFGPAVRDADGGVRQYGAIPPKDGQLRMRSYTVGGGHGGNVARGAISVVSGSIPFVAKVENRRAAQGGVDGEDLEAAKARGPIVLQTRSRAVTAEDFEQLTREGAPEVARVRCAPAGEGVDAGSVRVLIVPAAPVTDGRIRFEELRPSTATFEAIRRHLDTCRLVGTRVIIEPPNYRGITVVARLVARPRANASRVREDALTALHRHLNPLTGGPDKDGWPFGRPVQSGEIFAVLQAIRGVELVEDVRIFGADPITGVRGQATQRLELGPHDLVFSYEHQVMVEGG